MQRIERLLEGISKEDAGIEIAPWLSPIAAKRDGYNIRILDIFDRERLKAIATADPNECRGTDRLEEVDFVGNACDIANIVPAKMHGTFSYVISSHNFEHLPDPIRFLQGCERILAPGGVLSMAVPDRRACFDSFRPHTVIGDWIAAHLEGRQKPTPRQIFEVSTSFVVERAAGHERFAFRVGVPLTDIHCTGDLKSGFRDWREASGDAAYHDCHCTVMTPASLELLLVDARHSGLIGLEVEKVSQPLGGEFFVRLRRPESKSGALRADIAEVRTRLMREIIREYAVQAGYGRPLRARIRPLARGLRALGRKLRGK